MLHASSVPLRLSDPVIDLVAAHFRVLGEPTRIRLLDRLRDGDATVHELHETIGGTQQNVSKHLGVLLQAGLVRRTKEGTSARYAIADQDVFALCDQVCRGIRKQVADLDALLHQGGSR